LTRVGTVVDEYLDAVKADLGGQIKDAGYAIGI
jgi:hypothetical protein